MIKTNITEELYQYAIQFGVREHSVLTELRHKTDELTNSQMQIPLDQGGFMGLLAKIINAQKYLEIGVFTGYSSLVMALNMNESGKVYALDINNEYVNTAKEYWKKAQVEHKINFILGHAIDSLNNLQSEHKQSFDIAFIDANKADYVEYYQLCYELVKPGGLILIDNVLFGGEVLKETPPARIQAIKKLNEIVYNDARVNISMLTIGDGLTIVHKPK